MRATIAALRDKMALSPPAPQDRDAVREVLRHRRHCRLLPGPPQDSSLFSHEEGDELPQCGHTHAYPDGPRIETAGEGIVTLAWLLRRLVKIEHYRDTCHEEEEKYHPELLYTTLSGECLPKEAGYAEKQRKHEITVVARIVLTQIVRQQRLVAKTRVIDKGMPDIQFPASSSPDWLRISFCRPAKFHIK